MVLTGVRTVGLYGLRWLDFDFEKRLIHIRRNRFSIDGFGVGHSDSTVTLEVYSHFSRYARKVSFRVKQKLNKISKK